ncbi:MAG: sodium/solute symporter, partial [Myxococcales bacterium]|nr:sodium/solute symporter [Myxococcales bacterium]
MQIELSAIDLTVLVFYFVVTLGVGLWVARREGDATEEDYFVGGRAFGWFAIGASLFATNISSEHIVGLATDGFRIGLAVGNYEWGAVVVLVLLGTVFVPFYIGSRVRTMPEFLERRFGPGARMYLSILTLAANVLVRVSVSLYAGSVVLHQLFGIDTWTSIFVLSVVTVIYTVHGGLKAVVYTDAIQAVVLVVGSVVLTVTAVSRVGGIGALLDAVPPETLDMVRPASDPDMPWPGLVFGVPILGIWYWCTDQVIVQRVLGAKSMQEARKGTLFAAVLKIFPVFIFVLPGVCARVLFPDADAKAIYPMMISKLLPTGLTGLVAAGLIAALMSSISSTLNSTRTLVSLDLYRRLRPDAASTTVVRVGQITTVIVMVFGIAWVFVVARFESIFQYLQQVQAAISPPIAAAFLFGVFWRRANYRGVMMALVGGLL